MTQGGLSILCCDFIPASSVATALAVCYVQRGFDLFRYSWQHIQLFLVLIQGHYNYLICSANRRRGNILFRVSALVPYF